ncbi:MAG: hypothetical protein DM484_02610 [Candidatus Methylumidiphilus alinenensis]|uniref:VWFA domain-containing protein n=1 Tax=Candidatus Methylumidiphilus alinenensis TaxID=2202197 RepID=A0A2W4RL25_9GAMM|nr:MAG: hypothetical protein DM484_02610 [Candidatus Methylumidiphilus alinenensis]
MTMLKWLCWLMLGVYGFCGVAQADPHNHNKHIRVVLDLSLSMRQDKVIDKQGRVIGYKEGNDPGGMAILSTLLLYDLAHLDIASGDSFKVIPFHKAWNWSDPAQKPDIKNGPIIEAQKDKLGGRARFVSAIKALKYEAECTHFYPGLEAATKDLEDSKKDGDTRIIVLVTDGLPDNPCHGTKPTLDAEKRYIEQDIVPRMISKEIGLYVLAFGPSVKPDFFRQMTTVTNGDLKIDPNGDKLLEEMLELYAKSLGYENVPPYPLPKTDLELTQGAGQGDDTAVVVFNPKTSIPAQIPTINNFTPAPNAPVPSLHHNAYQSEIAPVVKKVANSRDGEPGAAYTLGWVQNPWPGIYKIDISPTRGMVALLRPPTAKIEFVNLPDTKKTPLNVEVMARSPLPLGFLVSNQGGGNPGKEITIQYKLTSDEIGKTNDRTLNAQPSSTILPPTPGGVVFTLPSEFPEKPNNPDRTYDGFIEGDAYKGKRFLARLSHPVTVYPYLSITPNPLKGIDGPLGKDEKSACTTFKLKVDGHLPELKPGKSKYSVTARIDYKNIAAIDQEFYGTRFSLDKDDVVDDRLQFDNPASPSHPTHAVQLGKWFTGQDLSATELTKEHKVCVTIGKPKTANPSNKLDLKVHFRLRYAPYEDADVIAPFTWQLTLADVPSPGPPSKTLLSLLALALLALLWHLRGQPKLPPDLAFALAPDGAGAKLEPRRLGEGSQLSRVLGLAVEKPIIADSGDEPLAWVRPVDGELYQLRMGKGVSLTRPDGPPPVQIGDLVTVSVHHVYTLRRGKKAHRVRLEYRA